MVLGVEEELEVVPEPVMAAMLVAANGGVLQRSVDPLHLPMGPSMAMIGQ